MDAHFRSLERMYHGAPINRFYAPRLVVDAGVAELRIPMRPEFHHAAASAHGSVLFKALDDAAYFAAASLVRDHLLVTADFHMHFLRPWREGALLAHGRAVYSGKRQWVADAVARDEAGEELARGSGTFLPTSIPLDERLGYARDAPG